MYQLERDQINLLIEIVREESGDNLARGDFTEAALQLFENIAGFETLPDKQSSRYINILWQGYQLAIRAPKLHPEYRQ